MFLILFFRTNVVYNVKFFFGFYVKQFLIIFINLSKVQLTGQTTEPLLTVLGWGLLKGLIALGIILALGRWLFRPIFNLIAMTRALELFTLTVLLIAIAAAVLTNALGLSYALGAFLAGIMLAETEFRHQIEVETRPFRDVLLVLFFVSVGMLLNIPTWAHTWLWIVLLLIALLIGKAVLIFILSRACQNDTPTAIRTSLVLAQGGEFGIVILFLALQTHLISQEYGQVILSALLLSMIISPFIIQHNKKITQLLLPKHYRKEHEKSKVDITEALSKLQNPIVIFGYGRVGRNVAKILRQEKIEHLIVDHNPSHVHQARLNGDPVIYGEATYPGIIKIVDSENARAVVICLDNMNFTIKCLTHIRKITPSLPILVRSHDEADVKKLQSFGATIVIPETTESSLIMAYHLLTILDIPDDNIQELLSQISQHNELLSKLLKS
ncbi:cation:proton antiporter [Candidiatus Paracoxiella cheracis]|uniref:cation:proton antiporter domain-containing protein n=1 Tax=Candidiatus Paracoxiella cheracis TaxID=3405120 RepID=UPI003BF4B0D3